MLSSYEQLLTEMGERILSTIHMRLSIFRSHEENRDTLAGKKKKSFPTKKVLYDSLALGVNVLVEYLVSLMPCLSLSH